MDDIKMESPRKIKLKLFDLPPDCLEKIASYMDARTNLNLLYSNKKVYSKLTDCTFFWKHLCELEGLDKMDCLKDEEVNTKEDEDNRNKTSSEATRWQKIYQRVMRMRRNLAEGNYDMWRLFMIEQVICKENDPGHPTRGH